MRGFLFSFLFLLTVVCSSQEKKDFFSVGNKCFLLNDKPFVIKAAELHYTRIPHQYWEHRIEMCKALGMNTICLYIFWNIHEQTPDNFNFAGQNDVAHFCRLAQEHGMYVIVRPGPYVCAEWEMGGLPWWLLKKKDIQLRTSDKYFLERTRVFMNAVGEQLKDLQISKGGNIIMVQVENEYGSYATDKEYVATIRDIIIEAGFDDMLLFQCDWNSNFLNNALDDLIWTINFGTGANIENQFAKLKELRPESPLMCSEFWSGWFDHWGRPHETRDKDALVNGLKEMLDENISFSLYMTHGGTTFGHWGGANSPPYSSMCSSYDYDAPINEAGQTTEKFFAVRELLKNYIGEEEVIADVPASIPMIEIPEFEVSEVALLFDNLPESVKSNSIMTMEEVDQGWGTILYRTKLSPILGNSTLKVSEVHDWAQVFLNGKLIGILDRRHNQNTLPLPVVTEESVLDILVEAMGRVNFGKTIHDRKGITEKVEIIQDSKAVELKDWEIYCIPVDYIFKKSIKYTLKNENNEPAFYKGEFTIDETGDSYLDMSNWGKGLVWVNGHSLGRFWRIGPQQTLFLPGCWLQQGKNEVVILDLDFPEKMTLRGINYPILDVIRTDHAKHRNDDEYLNLTGIKIFHSGCFTEGNGWQEVLFEKSKITRYFCLESLSSHGGDNSASIAELDVLDKNGKPLNRDKWKIVYADSEEILAGNHSADKVYDLQESTFWHTEYSQTKSNHPHYIVVDLGENIAVKGFRYLPRPEANYPGMIKDYNVYLMKDSELTIDLRMEKL